MSGHVRANWQALPKSLRIALQLFGAVILLLIVLGALLPKPASVNPQLTELAGPARGRQTSRSAQLKVWPLRGSDIVATVVPASFDPRSLPLAAKRYCGAREFCWVFAWADEASASRGFPMTDGEAASIAFVYQVNRGTGFENILWNCKVYPRRAADECMAEDDDPDPLT